MKYIPIVFKRIIIASIIAVFFFQAAGAQPKERYNVFSYSVNDGLLQTTLIDISVDTKNFCWISFPNGIQKFDGINFTNVPVQAGLPDDKWVNFLSVESGMFITHSRGVSRYDLQSNRFSLVWKNSESEVFPATFLGEDNGCIYIFTSSGNIVGLNSTTGKQESLVFSGIVSSPDRDKMRAKPSSDIVNHHVVVELNDSFYLWNLQQQKLAASAGGFKSMTPRVLLTAGSGEFTIIFYNFTHLISYNFNTDRQTVLLNLGSNEQFAGRFIVSFWEEQPIVSMYNRLFFTGPGFDNLQKELVDFQNKPAGDAATISKIQPDLFGNLYMMTVNGGLRKVIRHNYPIRYYGTNTPGENFIVSLLPDKQNNHILAGATGNGVLIFDTLQQLVKHVRTLPGSNKSFTTTAITKDEQGNYYLYIWGEKETWRLSKDLQYLAALPYKATSDQDYRGVSYFAKALYSLPEKSVVFSQGWLHTTNFLQQATHTQYLCPSSAMSAILNGNNIVTYANDRLLFFDAVTGDFVKDQPLLNTGEVRCFTDGPNQEMFLGSNKGIFHLDKNGRLIEHLTKETGLPDECVYAILPDANGNLWCSSNKGIFRIDKQRRFLLVKKQDGLQENEFNTNVAAVAHDGELFFGGINGISSFHPEQITSFDDKLSILVTRIRVNNEDAFSDTAVWNIDEITLPYNRNSISFDFIAMANNNPGQYVYQYKMTGWDNEWVNNNSMQTVRYLLPPGQYVFNISASRSFDKKALPLKQIRITIYPPFWKTWWFIGIAVLLMITLMGSVVTMYIRRKYASRLAALETERKLQSERERISRDLHDSIGAYANAVLYNTELLEKEQQTAAKLSLMKDLRFASKDIITSLRETIWALKNETYSAEDCFIRVRNFIHPLTRYYAHIAFSIEGATPPQLILHHNRAFHVVRIVQEAVTNAVKHSQASQIRIISEVVGTQWKLTVIDNGYGFIDGDGDGHGNGLINMQQRANEADLQLTISSKAQEGTKIAILV